MSRIFTDRVLTLAICDASYLRQSLTREICRVCADHVLILSWSVMQAFLGSPYNKKDVKFAETEF